MSLSRFLILGQGATEYLVILATVLLIALIGAALLGAFPETTGDVSMIESQIYWRGHATPIRVLEASSGTGSFCGISSANGYMMKFENSLSVPVKINSITVDGNSYSFCEAGSSTTQVSVDFDALQQKKVLLYALGEEGCSPGSRKELDLSFLYDSTIESQLQRGARSLILECSDTIDTSLAGSEQTFEIATGSLPDGACGYEYPYSGSGPLVSPFGPLDPFKKWRNLFSEDSEAQRISFSDEQDIEGIVFTPPSLPAGPSGYQFEVRWKSGPLATAEWAATGLPGGLTLSTGGFLSGTPCERGLFNPKFIATIGNDMVEKEIPLVILSGLGCTCGQNPVEIVTTSMSTAFEERYYSYQLEATGGTGSYGWTMSGLPPGLTYTPYGFVYGTPEAGSENNYTIFATVRSGGENDSGNITLRVRYGVITLRSTLPSSVLGTYYNQAVNVVSGGTAPFTWSLGWGSLPDGWSLSASNGSIYGTSLLQGNYSFNITVDDSEGLNGTKNYFVRIAGPISITTASVTGGHKDMEYSYFIEAEGGNPDYTWSIVSGSLPNGLSLDTSTGEIFGTPTEKKTLETFTIQAVDSSYPQQSDLVSLSMEIADPLYFVTSSALASGVVGSSYSQYIYATGGKTPYYFLYLGGEGAPGGYIAGLPPGISFEDSGNKVKIRGKPTAAGNYWFRAQVADDFIGTATQYFTITVTE